MRRVVLANEDVALENVTKDKGYVMKGRKGDYITARDTNGKFIWVKLDPAKTTKPVHAYDTLTKAIKDKMDKGYEVFEYSNVIVE